MAGVKNGYEPPREACDIFAYNLFVNVIIVSRGRRRNNSTENRVCGDKETIRKMFRFGLLPGSSKCLSVYTYVLIYTYLYLYILHLDPGRRELPACPREGRLPLHIARTTRYETVAPTILQTFFPQLENFSSRSHLPPFILHPHSLLLFPSYVSYRAATACIARSSCASVYFPPRDTPMSYNWRTWTRSMYLYASLCNFSAT